MRVRVVCVVWGVGRYTYIYIYTIYNIYTYNHIYMYNNVSPPAKSSSTCLPEGVREKPVTTRRKQISSVCVVCALVVVGVFGQAS